MMQIFENGCSDGFFFFSPFIYNLRTEFPWDMF